VRAILPFPLLAIGFALPAWGLPAPFVAVWSRRGD
jgi:hypothetical protein